MTRSIGRSVGLALAAALLVTVPPARAAEPDGESAAAAEGEAPVEPEGEATIEPYGETAREPYEYPGGPEEPDAYPTGWVRVPAAAADLLLVRPAMVAGLAAGAVAFVVTLPFTAPTLTTDDAAHALFDQTLSALARPLGEF